MADEEKKEEQEQKKKGSGLIIKLIVVIIVVALIGGVGFMGWKYYQARAALSEKKVVEPTVQIGAMWSLGSMIVNLLDNNGERYLKATIEIELSSLECLKELDNLRPKISDSILDLLSSKSYKEIVGFEGKQHLREEIAMRLNNLMSKGRITHVYFTEFVVQ